MANQLSFGFGKTDITPTEPVSLAGYYYDRQSTGVHDRLAARSMAVSDGEHCAVLCVVDLISLTEHVVTETRRLLQHDGTLEPHQLLLSAVHSHTTPALKREQAYESRLPLMLAESVRLAIADLSPCTAKIATGDAPGLQFIRRYRMKDGSVVTNPGILNPDVVESMGTPDSDVLTLIVSNSDRTVGGLVNFGLHCDTVGGTEISADWTYYLRHALQRERALAGTLLTPIACCGDVNHWNVFEPVAGRDFGETERIGGRLAANVIASLQTAQPVLAGRVGALRQRLEVSTRMPTEPELTAAKETMTKPPAAGVDFELSRVDAARRVRAAALGPRVTMELTVLAFGNTALVGIPAELFSALGREIRARSPFTHTATVTLADRNICYVGTKKDYADGGYEMVSSVVVPGTGERIVDAAVAMLRQAHDQVGI